MSVGHNCVREVDLAQMNESAWCASERMHQRGVGSLVVTNESKEPIGIVTDRDIVERVVAKSLDPTVVLVGQIMTSNPQTVHDDDSIEFALKLMRKTRCRRLPVIEGQGKLVGLISLDDILMLLAEELADIGRLLNRETPRGLAQEFVEGERQALI